MMETRNAVHPEHAILFDTAEMREHFLIQDLFKPDEVKLVYSYFDRLIVGGICPVNPLKLAVDEKIIGASFLLERRELGVINIGAAGAVTVDGETHDLSPKDGLYVGMGAEKLESGSVWNTMPVHTHQRRMEAYFYFGLADDQVVFHFMGEPSETRHLVVRNEEAVLSPSWSIHSGAGTGAYTFIWGMVGENQTFTDMDAVPMNYLM